MNKLLLIPVFCFGLAGCGHTKKDQADNVQKFSPPAIAVDNEIVEKEPLTVEELNVADPGPKEQKGDPAANIRIAEPAGNADVKETALALKKPENDLSQKIIKQGDISFETGNITQTRKTILASLKKSGGYISEENETNNGDDGRKEYTLKTRIPAKKFDGFLNDVSSAAVQIDSKNISSRDVTTQYIDMATRLQNRLLLESRYQALLKQANNMGDILKIEHKLSQIRSEIESEQGQLNYLSKQVEYSSLDITFYTRHITSADKGYGTGYKLVKALGQGWDTLTGWVFSLVALWPLLTIVIVLFLVLKRWHNHKRALTI